jgi:hypothetical protein
MYGVYAESMPGALPVPVFLLCPWMDGMPLMQEQLAATWVVPLLKKEQSQTSRQKDTRASMRSGYFFVLKPGSDLLCLPHPWGKSLRDQPPAVQDCSCNLVTPFK